MLRSMTGYGRGEYSDSNFSFVIEIKTINHRYAETVIRMPRFLNALEDRLRKTVLKQVKRGRAEIFINADYTSDAGVAVKVDHALAKAYAGALRELAAVTGVENAGRNAQSELFFLARCPEVIAAKEGYFDVESLWPAISQATEDDLSVLVQMREKEGSFIGADLLGRAVVVEEKLAVIKERAPLIAAEYRVRLTERLNDLLSQYGQTVEPERIIQEAAIFADRVNITEEVVRLSSHIEQFRGLLREDKEPVGRKLDFLMQEFNREANTIGSKANDRTLAQTVVELKAEIEKIREQIQNLE